MASSKITKIELYNHLFLGYFTALVYINDSDDIVARVDDGIVSMVSTLATRIAGVDALMQNPTLETFKNHPMVKFMSE